MHSLHEEVDSSLERTPGTQAACALGIASIVMWSGTQQLQKAKRVIGRQR